MAPQNIRTSLKNNLDHAACCQRQTKNCVCFIRGRKCVSILQKKEKKKIFLNVLFYFKIKLGMEFRKGIFKLQEGTLFFLRLKIPNNDNNNKSLQSNFLFYD